MSKTWLAIGKDEHKNREVIWGMGTSPSDCYRDAQQWVEDWAYHSDPALCKDVDAELLSIKLVQIGPELADVLDETGDCHWPPTPEIVWKAKMKILNPKLQATG